MELILIIGGGAALYLSGMASYHYLLKNNPAKLEKLLALAREAKARAGQ